MRKRTNQTSFIEFHSSYLIVAMGFILTGNYLTLVVFSVLILIHEFGHTVMAFLLHVKVKKIIIYPFGGMTVLSSMINLDSVKELLIALAGVMMQMLGYLMICYFGRLGLIRDVTIELFTLYNSRMIFFNLMPIYPLDGGRILQLLLSCFFPYQIANLFITFISFLVLFLLLFLQIYFVNYSNIMVYLLLFTYIIKFYDRRHDLYYRFLMERYLYSFMFDRVKKINNYHYMYKDRKHIIDDGIKKWEEKDFLQYLFHHNKN